jgi:hypothetical protein
MREFSPSTTKNNMQVTRANATVGQEVKLTSTRWGDARNNPVWGGSQGQVKGKVSSIEQNWLAVDWDNGTRNHYSDTDLESIEVATPTLTIGLSTTPATPAPATPSVATESLQTVVQNVINEQIAAGNSFSAYDITTKVRAVVNAGAVVLENRPVEDVNGRQTQRVTHDEVRPLVRSIMDTQSSYDRRFNGDYIVYQPNGTPATPSLSTTVATPIPASKSLTFTPTGTTSTGSFSGSQSVDKTRLVTYITNKGSRTLKQIQSRFKVEGAAQPTVREIATAATSAGLRIDTKTPYYASVVTL